jgi:hypothetical protein
MPNYFSIGSVLFKHNKMPEVPWYSYINPQVRCNYHFMLELLKLFYSIARVYN